MDKINLPSRKKVRHLTLLREPRSISVKEFNALRSEERLDIVRRATGREKHNLILEARDAEVLVRRLPAQEIYLLIKELGPESAAELLTLVNTEQFTTFLDLDCWQEAQLDGPRLLQWLMLLAEGGEDKVLQTVLELDFELLVLILKKFAVVVSGPEADDDDEARPAGPGGYELAFNDPEGGKVIGYLVETLFNRENNFARRLMEALRWEQDALLEEEVYHFRSGRLQDRGFYDTMDALGVYAFLDPEGFNPEQWRKAAIIPGEEGVEAPGFMLSGARARDLLAEVLAGGVTEEFCWELSYLLNKVMAADRIDVGDASQVLAETEGVYRCLNLALEHLCGGDAVRAAQCLDDLYLEALFRLGFSLTLQLQRRAAPLCKSQLGPYLDGPFRALVDALQRRKPQFFEGIERPDRGGERPFANLHELRLATEWLERLEVQQRLFEDHFPFSLPAPGELELTGCQPDDPEDLALSDFFLTALANRIMGREFLPQPIPREELVGLHARICTESKLHDALRQETRQWLDSLVPGAGAFGEYCLELWAEEYCTMGAENLDPRYVGSLLIKLV